LDDSNVRNNATLMLPPLDVLVTLSSLALVASITPGPNNAMLAASGANYGLRRSIPHVIGIALGFALMIFLIGLFLGEVFQRSVVLREILRWAAAGLLVYVAWKIATARGLGTESAATKPFSFLQAASFQWVNPKGWAMGTAITAQFVNADAALQSALLIALVFVVVAATSSACWLLLGHAIGRLLKTSNNLLWFNRAMAAIILLCLVLLFIE
jgi:threonine/homoserine/homoserine lactone efflux protein